MLMFLGEYFKVVIMKTEYILNSNKDMKNGPKHQEDFFLTHDIMNSLGTACKMYIERPR